MTRDAKAYETAEQLKIKLRFGKGIFKVRISPLFGNSFKHFPFMKITNLRNQTNN